MNDLEKGKKRKLRKTMMIFFMFVFGLKENLYSLAISLDFVCFTSVRLTS